jgi:antitoxin VapB
MTAHETKIFKSGNSVAVRLPKEFGFAEGTSVLMEQRGGSLVIRPATDLEEEKRRVRELIAGLRAIGFPEDGIQPRPEFEAPERIDLK